MPHQHYILRKGLIVDIGEYSFELLENVEAISMMDAVDMIDGSEGEPLSGFQRQHISEVNRLSSIVSDFDIVAGGDLDTMASAEKVQ